MTIVGDSRAVARRAAVWVIGAEREGAGPAAVAVLAINVLLAHAATGLAALQAHRVAVAVGCCG